MSRLTRGLGALGALVLGVIGVPIALVVLGGNPFPRVASLSSLGRALLTPDDGSLLVGLITVVGWIAWLVFALSVGSELLGVLSHRRIRIRLPGLAGPQRLAAGLLISVAAMLSVPQVAEAPPSVSAVPVSGVESAHPPMTTAERNERRPDPDVMSAAGPSATVPAGTIHVVKPGDDLWSLAERYYGRGRDWRKIAAANPRLLTGGPDRLQPGWRLAVPDVDAAADRGDQRSVEVGRGDTLSAIAERELGSVEAWSDIYRLNRFQLDDPDELAVGMRLILPEDAAARTKPAGASEEKGSRPRGQHSSGGTPGPNAPIPEPPPTQPERPTAEPPAPTQSAPTQSAPEAGADRGAAPGAQDVVTEVVAPLAAVGGLLAAGLLAGLLVRRRTQLQLRPVGRRILQPPPPAQAVEVALGRRQRPLSLRTLDRASRAIAAHCRRTGAPLPPLQYALVGESELELVLGKQCPDAPVGFTVRGRSWLVSQADAGYLSSVPGSGETPRPWPALVTLGHDDGGRLIVADLEGIGLLQVRSSEAEHGEGVLAAMAVELSFSPWAEEMILTLVGGLERLPAALGKHNVSRTDDVDALLTRLELRAAAQREHSPQSVLGQHRIDPDLADPWAPEIVLVNASLTAAQRRRLDAVLTSEPRVTMAAVTVDPTHSAPWSLQLVDSSSTAAVLEPAGLAVTAQHLDPPAVEAVVDLVATTGSDLTTPAPWWAAVPVPPEPPPDNVTFLGQRLAGWAVEENRTAEGVSMTAVTVGAGAHTGHPILKLMGPVELSGAAGSPPPRAGKQCLEYCAWLLEHPGTSAQAMTAALIVAEGTRRSNMSRLRGWLGSDPTGEPYLPDAYTGRIRLHPWVSSDWQQLQILTGGGVNRTGIEGLRAALEIVRGAPLADAAPGQWHWAEELRTDMISCVRDIGVELTTQALQRDDIDLARWAAARALLAAPGDELLMAARIRTEHRAGNPVETERLTLQLAAQARALGVDLDQATVVLLQQVMEGRVRARMA